MATVGGGGVSLATVAAEFEVDIFNARSNLARRVASQSGHFN